MARTTAKQVLDRVDALLPNGYARAEKLRWLAQAEGFVRRELCRETGELPVLTEETELTAAPPFDELYRHYVEAQVHYANGETARYNSAAGLWNNAFLTYRDYRARTAVPEGASFLLQWCISMTSASGKNGAAALANCIMRTAPVVKLGA